MVAFGSIPMNIPQIDLKEVGHVLGTHGVMFKGYDLDS